MQDVLCKKCFEAYDQTIIYFIVEYHRGLGGNTISKLDNGDFSGLIYSLLV